MTFAIGHVDGGTHGGWKKQHPKPKDWSCPTCVQYHPGYRTACSTCKTKRPG